MKTILLFGAGKSATVLIDYLLEHSQTENWNLIVADADLQMAQSKIGTAQRAKAVCMNASDTEARSRYIRQADIVISLLPPHLHIHVAQDCIHYHKNLLTASYVDEEIKKLEPEIKSRNLLFLCETGLDPGIDHMSAKKLLDEIHDKGGKVKSFLSHCGGLVSPESDDNPWHYKISWNPKNIILAGKAGARFIENGKEKNIPYEKLFAEERLVEIPGLGIMGWYPNRDSTRYAKLYGLDHVHTFIRTTLRHSDFIYGWKNIIDLKLTDETKQYNTDGKTLHQVYKEHMDKNGFSDRLNQILTANPEKAKQIPENRMKIFEKEPEAASEGSDFPNSFMEVDEKRNPHNREIDKVKNSAAEYKADKMHRANLILKQLLFLGMDDDDTMVNKGFCSPADILQFAMEKKMSLQSYDKDMIVMLHEIMYETEKQNYLLKSLLKVTGENYLRTAMAKTVGLPLGIAARLILNGKIRLTGLHIPISKDIYEPVLKELELYKVKFTDTITAL